MRGIEHLHPELQPVVEKFVAECKKQGLPVLITETWRSKQEQDSFYAKGRTAPGNIITNAKYPYSPHCWGVAFDFCRNVKGREYDNSDGFFDKVGRIAEKLFDGTEYDLFWGGDWKNFVDKPHVEMKKYMPNGSVNWLVSKYGNPENFKKTWSEAKKGTVYRVDQTKVRVDEKVIDVRAINHENQNYINIRDLEKAGIKIGYDNIKKMPIIITK